MRHLLLWPLLWLRLSGLSSVPSAHAALAMLPSRVGTVGMVSCGDSVCLGCESLTSVQRRKGLAHSGLVTGRGRCRPGPRGAAAVSFQPCSGRSLCVPGCCPSICTADFPPRLLTPSDPGMGRQWDCTAGKFELFVTRTQQGPSESWHLLPREAVPRQRVQGPWEAADELPPSGGTG